MHIGDSNTVRAMLLVMPLLVGMVEVLVRLTDSARKIIPMSQSLWSFHACVLRGNFSGHADPLTNPL